MHNALERLTAAICIASLSWAVHSGESKPPKQDPATKADTNKNETPDTPDGLRVSLATHFAEIKRRLADKSPAQRRTAMPLLAEVKREESGRLLVELALFDPDTEIRMEAFRQLCHFPDLEGKIAYQVALIFHREINPWVKQTEAHFMTRLKFKHAPLKELVRYILGMDEPDFTVYDDQYDSQGGKLGGGGAKGGGRDHFTLIVQALNTIAGRNFPANRETATQVAQWWKINEFDYQRADKELAIKNRQDGIVGLNLVPPGSARTSTAGGDALKEEPVAKADRAEQIARGQKLLKGILGEDDEEPAVPSPAKPTAKPADKKPAQPLTENDIE